MVNGRTLSAGTVLIAGPSSLHGPQNTGFILYALVQEIETATRKQDGRYTDSESEEREEEAAGKVRKSWHP